MPRLNSIEKKKQKKNGKNGLLFCG